MRTHCLVCGGPIVVMSQRGTDWCSRNCERVTVKASALHDINLRLESVGLVRGEGADRATESLQAKRELAVAEYREALSMVPRLRDEATADG